MITLRNDYHNTETHIEDRWGDNPDGSEAWERLQIEALTDTNAERIVARVAADLCGLDGCTCGTVRGKQA